MDLAGRVRDARERVGLSQEKLAHKMGIDRNTLWHIEAGRTKNPRADQIRALAKALLVSADYLLGLTDDAAPRPKPRKKRAPANDAGRRLGWGDETRTRALADPLPCWMQHQLPHPGGNGPGADSARPGQGLLDSTHAL